VDYTYALVITPSGSVAPAADTLYGATIFYKYIA
jgi:hypothetical protein